MKDDRKMTIISGAYFVMLIILVLYTLIQAVKAMEPEKPIISTETVPALVNLAVKGLEKTDKIKGKGEIYEVTAFTSTECGTKFCREHAGREREYLAAIRKDLLPASKIYIPAFDRYYDVIPGAPASGTDIDLFMADYQEALDFGRKSLLVYIIK